ncbi:MAG TPA: hypothetical protein VEN99_09905 [Acidimicrobiia bacterium]|nr:hypothetical protein [Acidimicrobiia bacterium]
MNLDRLAELPGQRILQASLAGTLVFAVTAVPAAAGVDALKLPAAVVSLVLFVVSIPLALLALARAAVRTARQEDRITVGGLFLLQGSAPRPVRRLLLGSLVVALAVTAVTASGEPFGVLQPVFPLALCARWSARHGTFPRIPDPDHPGPRPPG